MIEALRSHIANFLSPDWRAVLHHNEVTAIGIFAVEKDKYGSAKIFPSMRIWVTDDQITLCEWGTNDWGPATLLDMNDPTSLAKLEELVKAHCP